MADLRLLLQGAGTLPDAVHLLTLQRLAKRKVLLRLAHLLQSVGGPDPAGACTNERVTLRLTSSRS